MAKLMTMTYDLARAIGQDAGNASMREGGRTGWNKKDYNAACVAMEKACELIPGGLGRDLPEAGREEKK